MPHSAIASKCAERPDYNARMNAMHHSRRQSAITIVASATLVWLLGCSTHAHHASVADSHATTSPVSVTPAQAQQNLVAGNARFVAGKSMHPHQTPAVRAQLVNGQAPFAVIVGCSDSRTAPEILFDEGLGDLFIIRVAGNVIDDQSIGSVEYAVEHLHSPLVVVMGHSTCGAVGAARDAVAAHGHADGHIESLVQAIRPAVEQTAGQDAAATCKANVRNVVNALRDSQPILHHMVEHGDVRIVGAYYDLESGVVTFVND